MLSGWRGLGLAWGLVAALLLVLAGVLAWAPRGTRPRPAGAPIAAPDPALLVAAPDFPGRFLPRVGADGRIAARVYAARATPAAPGAGVARVALLVAGFGLNRLHSLAALQSLPRAVDFAVTAHLDHTDLMPLLRASGHEFLASIPMQPQDYPNDDEGEHQLLLTAQSAANTSNLEWVLSHIEGYAGVTGVSDGQMGGGFAANPVMLGWVEREAARRGLFYIDPRPGASAVTPAARAVDVQIGSLDTDEGEPAQLAALAAAARAHGSAIGLVAWADPATIVTLQSWTAALPELGLQLVPVSALMEGPG